MQVTILLLLQVHQKSDAEFGLSIEFAACESHKNERKVFSPEDC